MVAVGDGVAVAGVVGAAVGVAVWVACAVGVAACAGAMTSIGLAVWVGEDSAGTAVGSAADGMAVETGAVGSVSLDEACEAGVASATDVADATEVGDSALVSGLGLSQATTASKAKMETMGSISRLRCVSDILDS